MPSVNYQDAVERGWAEGESRYADCIPHHGEDYIFTSMHDPARERLLTLIIEGRVPEEGGSITKCPSEASAQIWLVEYFPHLSDDPGDDYYRAEGDGTIRSYLVRKTSAATEEILLDGNSLEITSDGWDRIEAVPVAPSETLSEWRAEYFGAEIARPLADNQPRAGGLSTK